MKYRPLFLALITAALLPSVVPAQVATVEFGDGAILVSRSFKEENTAHAFEISADYPELQKFDQAIAEKLNKLIRTSIMKNVDEFRKSMLDMSDAKLKAARERGVSNYMEVNYAVAIANSDILSISFDNTTYSGGAHPTPSAYTVNFDLHSGNELKLSDLFNPGANYLKVISDYAIADLIKQKVAIDEGWIARGAGPIEDNFRIWTITKDGLRFEFEPYQVAPYVAGPQNVLVPFSELKDLNAWVRTQ